MSGEALRADVTFVTAVYERSPTDVLGGRGRPFAFYLKSLRSIARMGAPLVVYTQDRLVAAVEDALSEAGARASVIGRPLSSAPRFWPIQELRIRQRVFDEPYRDRCHVLCLAKVAWLAEQARCNPFATRNCFWIDAGLASDALFPASHLPRPDGVCDLFTRDVPDALGRRPGFVVFALEPMIGRSLHTVDVDAMQSIAGDGAEPIATHIVGGFLGGRAIEVLALADEYDAIVGDMLARGHLGTEENALTILFHRNRRRFTPIVFSTWYHEDTGFTRPAPEDVPFYRAFGSLIERRSRRTPETPQATNITTRRIENAPKAARPVHSPERQRSGRNGNVSVDVK